MCYKYLEHFVVADICYVMDGICYSGSWKSLTNTPECS